MFEKLKVGNLKLNLGSGGRLLPDFINIDMLDLGKFVHELPENTQYIRTDVFKLREYFASNSVKHIRASHFFEHLTHVQIIELLYILWDILQPDGTMEITTPNFSGIMELYQKKHDAGNFSDLDLLHTKIFNCEEETLHKSIWNWEIGIYYLEREGFFKLTQPPIKSLTCEEITFKVVVNK